MSAPELTHPDAQPERVGVPELRERILTRVLARLLAVRRVFGPALLCFALWIAWGDADLWRRAVLMGVAALLGILTLADAHMRRRLERGELEGRPNLIVNLLLIGGLQQVMFFATGGVASPFMPLMLPVAFIAGMLMPPRVVWVQVLAFHLPVIWIDYTVAATGTLDLLPDVLEQPLGGGPSEMGLLVLAVVMSAGVLLATVVSTTAAGGLDLMLRDTLRARDRALQVRTEQNHELSALSAEIAHELKNPLASIKGLAQLVKRELDRSESSSKAGERMGVLHREVERMQAILDEFLNFSRPLVPLNLREVEARELVTHVVDLHEAMAGEQRVELGFVDAGLAASTSVICDPRKVEQILINLVQNALEAVEEGTRIELELVARGDERVDFLVRDEGPGLSPALRGRLFELGVTDKAKGSGLGLTVARALARQHGGELELGDRSDAERGCEARLSLPRRPTPDSGKLAGESVHA